jgi:curved DNA-binding protein CbpA
MTTILIAPDDNGGHNVKLQSNDPDADAFKLVLKALKRIIDFEYRQYDRGDKLWMVNEDGFEQMILWVNHCRLRIGAEVKWQQEPPRSRRPQQQQPQIDPYGVLHLLPSAPPSVVKAAYRALATAHHPDKNGGDVVAMQQINRAYSQLTR